MAKLCFVTFVALTAVSYASILEFLVVPECVQLKPSGHLASSDVPLIVSNLLGLSSEKPINWHPTTSIWERPEAALLFVVKTPNHLKLKLPSIQAYKLVENDLPDFTEVSTEIERAFSEGGYTILNVNKDVYGQHANDIRSFIEPGKDTSSLSTEVSTARGVSNWIVTSKSIVRNGAPDLFVFEFDGLVDMSNDNSEKIDEAVNELKKTIKEVTGNFESVYDGNLIVAVVSGSGAKIRRPRAATPTPPPQKVTPPTSYNFYDENYPVIFNIILWTMLSIAISILFIAVAMWFMDPGRDSIIYRMTMTRAKKD